MSAVAEFEDAALRELTENARQKVVITIDVDVLLLLVASIQRDLKDPANADKPGRAAVRKCLDELVNVFDQVGPNLAVAVRSANPL